jgi:hypothetical protein
MKLMVSIDKQDRGFISKILKLHMPPSGGAVERSRMEFYFGRLNGTRFHEEPQVKDVKTGPKRIIDAFMPNKEFRDKYTQAMKRLFKQRAPIRQLEHEDIFQKDSDGKHRLNRVTFIRAFQSLNKDSSPGYPFVYYASTNEELDPHAVYECCNEVLVKWARAAKEFGTTDFMANMSYLECFTKGLVYPSMAFVKSEPTDAVKIARLIYGVSVVHQILSIILMGEYLKSLPESWDTACHKVGLDFSTDEGLKKLFRCTDRLFDVADRDGRKVQSDDIQGWEYNLRHWMHMCWYDELASGLTGTHAKLLRILCDAEMRMSIIDSDGFVHVPPTFFMYSGKLNTHACNSDARAALADVLNGYSDTIVDEITNETNGDDCIEVAVANVA